MADQNRTPALNWKAMRAIAARDLKVVSRSSAMMIPMIVLPVILLVLIPGALGYFAPAMNAAEELNDVRRFLEMMPAQMKVQFQGYTETQMMIVYMLVYFFAPLFLILPTMTASIIAAGSFAGEKERRTLEALLYTPTTDQELILGKMLAALVPAVLVELGGFVLYSVVVNAASWRTMGAIFFPNLMWIVMILWLAPAAAGLGLASMVLVSTKVNTFQDAYQLGSLVVLPLMLLILGQIAGVIYLSAGFAFLAGLVLWLIDAGVLWFAARTFQRGEIIARL
jgi:hypothetical protein